MSETTLSQRLQLDVPKNSNLLETVQAKPQTLNPDMMLFKHKAAASSRKAMRSQRVPGDIIGVLAQRILEFRFLEFGVYSFGVWGIGFRFLEFRALASQLARTSGCLGFRA